MLYINPIKHLFESLKKQFEESNYNVSTRSLRRTRETLKTQYVFADMFTFEKDASTLSNFIYYRITKYKQEQELITDNNKNWSHNIHKTYSKLSKLYQENISVQMDWLIMMCIIERCMLQLEYAIDPIISFNVLKQEKNNSTANYIILRAPFYDIVHGKEDMRVYFKKLEDYPQYSSINELVEKDKDFKSYATHYMINEMNNRIMASIGLIDQLINEIENQEIKTFKFLTDNK